MAVDSVTQLPRAVRDLGTSNYCFERLGRGQEDGAIELDSDAPRGIPWPS